MYTDVESSIRDGESSLQRCNVDLEKLKMIHGCVPRPTQRGHANYLGFTSFLLCTEREGPRWFRSWQLRG